MPLQRIEESPGDGLVRTDSSERRNALDRKGRLRWAANSTGPSTGSRGRCRRRVGESTSSSSPAARTSRARPKPRIIDSPRPRRAERERPARPTRVEPPTHEGPERRPEAILAGLGRLSLSELICWARYGPCSPVGPALFLTSRPIVEGLRPSFSAIWRGEHPARGVSAISMRSSRERWWPSTPFGFSTPPPRIPVDERPLVAAGQPGAPVPPDLAGSLGDADSPRGLREAHALPEVLEIALAPGPLHVAKLLVGDTLELARHFQHPSFPRALHSSLDSTMMVFPSGALFFGPLILARYN